MTSFFSFFWGKESKGQISWSTLFLTGCPKSLVINSGERHIWGCISWGQGWPNPENFVRATESMTNRLQSACFTQQPSSKCYSISPDSLRVVSKIKENLLKTDFFFFFPFFFFLDFSAFIGKIKPDFGKPQFSKKKKYCSSTKPT